MSYTNLYKDLLCLAPNGTLTLYSLMHTHNTVNTSVDKGWVENKKAHFFEVLNNFLNIMYKLY